MNVLYLGAGFVGACSAAVSADSGHRVLVYDIDVEKIKKLSSGDRDQIQSCLFEEGLADLIIRNSSQIGFTNQYSDVEKFLDSCEVVFMCLPTPEIGETGESDLSYYTTAAKKLGESLKKRNQGKQKKYVVIVNKSTVPISMVDRTEEIMNTCGVKEFGVVSNPEFLVEGKAIQGSLHPDRVVIGARNDTDFRIMRKVYRRFYDSSAIEYIEVNPEEAAAGKLLANFYLFNKLGVCFDIIGRTCEAFPGLSFENIRNILTTDPRIGTWGLYDSLYAGGSCFIKDARSLSHQLKKRKQNTTLVDETYHANKRQLQSFFGRAKKEAKISWKGKRVTILGVAFKQGTNDVRNSPSIDMVEWLLKEKVDHITIYDPVAMDSFEQLFPGHKKISYVSSAESTLDKNMDVLIIATDWPQFRSVGEMLVALRQKSLIMDGRRILQHMYPELVRAGYSIIAVGSPYIRPN